MSRLSFLNFYQSVIKRKKTPNNYTRKSSSSFPLSSSAPPSSTSFNLFKTTTFKPNLQEMKRVFDRYDTNKDGKISLEEYKAALMSTAANPLLKSDEVEARKAFEVADKDGDGYISFDEFLGVNMVGGGVKLRDIKSAFRVFDLDGDGRISAEELRKVMRTVGFGDQNGGGGSSSLEACRRMVSGVDKDGDGLINMDEFVTMMTRTMKLVS